MKQIKNTHQACLAFFMLHKRSSTLNVFKHKKTPVRMHRGVFLRSRADSNRCTSFCRALPSHSATRPDWGAKLQRFPRIHGIFFEKGHAHGMNVSVDRGVQLANLYL